MVQLYFGSGPKHTGLIALGSNQRHADHAPRDIMDAAVKAMPGNGLNVMARSRLYRSPAFPPGSGPDYVNAAVAVETTLNPVEVIALLHRIEAEFGRVRRERWAQRVLDLDLLALDDAILPDVTGWRVWADMPLEEQMRRTPEQAILPHPRLQERAFVLVPLNDIAPDWRHPVTGATVSGMLAALDSQDIAALEPLDGTDSP